MPQKRSVAADLVPPPRGDPGLAFSLADADARLRGFFRSWRPGIKKETAPVVVVVFFFFLGGGRLWGFWWGGKKKEAGRARGGRRSYVVCLKTSGGGGGVGICRKAGSSCFSLFAS